MQITFTNIRCKEENITLLFWRKNLDSYHHTETSLIIGRATFGETFLTEKCEMNRSGVEELG